MKRIKLLIVLFIGLCISCQREEVVESNARKSQIKYEEGLSSVQGIPMYKDVTTFFGYSNKAYYTSDIESQERKLSYKSLATKYSEMDNASYLLDEKGATNAESRVIGKFAPLVNEKGLVIIGGGLFRFSGENVYSTPLSDGIQLSKAIEMLAQPANYGSKVTVNEFHHQPFKVNAKNARVGPPGNNYINGYSEWNQGGRTSFYMQPQIVYGYLGLSDYNCTEYYVDENGYYNCIGESYNYNYRTQVYIYVNNTVTRRYCPAVGGCYTTDPGVWIGSNRAYGYLNYNFNGTAYSSDVNYNTMQGRYSYTVFYREIPANGPNDVTVQNFDMNSGKMTYECHLKDDNGYYWGNFFWSTTF